ncbi:MAG: hypothetical protein OEV07_16395, partial [Gammaproteobacteria bacterium]|nr:hypothetical protein [Gammaproteobacteria bacterium]
MPPKPKRKKAKSARRRQRRHYRLVGALVLVSAFAIYLGYLNHLINGRFEGDTWAIPSRVFARAQELYPNLALTREQLIYELELSSYLMVKSEPIPGQYRLLGESLEVYARPFDFGTQYQEARLVQIFFDQGRISGLVDSNSSQNLDLFRLPPVILG